MGAADVLQGCDTFVGELALAFDFGGEFLPFGSEGARRQAALFLKFMGEIAGGNGDLADRHDAGAFHHRSIVGNDIGEQVGSEADTQHAGHAKQSCTDRFEVHERLACCLRV